MTRNILIGIVAVVMLLAGGWWYFNQSNVPVTSETAQQNTTNTESQTPSQSPSSTINDETANWKLFVNSRDRYSVKYPSEEIAGTPSADCCSDLRDFGFNQSMSFMRYGGWADIYIFNGSLEEAIATHAKNIDSEHRVYVSAEDVVIGGKKGKVVNWTNILDSSSRVNHTYFVEYQPGKTLYIAGSKQFVSTIKFL